MLFNETDHPNNPPDTWQVRKVTDRIWHLTTSNAPAGDGPLDSFKTRKAAEQAKVSGWLVDLYEKERRWYAGEKVHLWRPWAEVKAEQAREAIR